MGYKRDWRKSEDYEYTKNHDNQMWAWEFLRRNDEYISDWKTHLAEEFKKDSSIKNKVSENDFRIKLPLESKKWGLLYGFVNPEIDKPKHLKFEKTRIVFNANLNLTGSHQQKNIQKIITSDFGHDSPNVFSPQTIFTKKKLNQQIELIYDKNDVIAFFDLSLEIKPQIKKIEPILRNIQSQKKDNGDLKVIKKKLRDRELWVMYLRIIDAKKDNAKSNEILKALYPSIVPQYPDRSSSNIIKDKYKQAKHWLENYRKIILH